jgi:hypothetical protein
VDPLSVPGERDDWAEPEFEVPNTELGFAGELGFLGTVGLSPETADCVVPDFEVPNTELGFAGELGFVGTAGLPAAPPAGLPAFVPPLDPVPEPAGAAPVPVDPPDAPPAPPAAPPDVPPPPPPPWANAIAGLATRTNATAMASILFIRRGSWPIVRSPTFNALRSGAFLPIREAPRRRPSLDALCLTEDAWPRALLVGKLPCGLSAKFQAER